MDVDKVGESIRNEPDNSLLSLLLSIDSLFSKLECALNDLHTNHKVVSKPCFHMFIYHLQIFNEFYQQIDHSVEGDSLLRLQFDKVPFVDKESSQWTAGELEDAVKLIYQNLSRLDSYLSLIVCLMFIETFGLDSLVVYIFFLKNIFPMFGNCRFPIIKNLGKRLYIGSITLVGQLGCHYVPSGCFVTVD